MIKVNKTKKYPNYTRVILASQSETRRKMLNKYFSQVICIPHNIDEEKFKAQKKDPEKIVLEIAKEKARSVAKDYPNEMIIASDQILKCEGEILSKPKTKQSAINKLLFLKNKTHELYSSIYVIQKTKFYFQQFKTASLFFANVTKKDIESYVKNNVETVLSTVGSYKIEENAKFKFIQIMKGDRETILGFPIKGLIKKIANEK